MIFLRYIDNLDFIWEHERESLNFSFKKCIEKGSQYRRLLHVATFLNIFIVLILLIFQSIMVKNGQIYFKNLAASSLLKQEQISIMSGVVPKKSNQKLHRYFFGFQTILLYTCIDSIFTWLINFQVAFQFSYCNSTLILHLLIDFWDICAEISAYFIAGNSENKRKQKYF